MRWKSRWVRGSVAVVGFLMWETTFYGIPASMSHQLRAATEPGAVRLLALVMAVACTILAIGPDRLSKWKVRLDRARGTTKPAPVAAQATPSPATAPATPLTPPTQPEKSSVVDVPADLVERLRDQYDIGYEVADNLGAAARSLRKVRGQPLLPKIDVWQKRVANILADWPNHRAHFLMELPMDQRLPTIGVLFANTGDELPRKPYLEFRLERLEDVIAELEHPSTPLRSPAPRTARQQAIFERATDPPPLLHQWPSTVRKYENGTATLAVRRPPADPGSLTRCVVEFGPSPIDLRRFTYDIDSPELPRIMRTGRNLKDHTVEFPSQFSDGDAFVPLLPGIYHYFWVAHYGKALEPNTRKVASGEFEWP